MEEDVNAHDPKISGYQVFRCRRQRVGNRCVRGEDPRACRGTRATSGGSGRRGTCTTATERTGIGSRQSGRHGRGRPTNNSRGCRRGTGRGNSGGRSCTRRSCRRSWWQSSASSSARAGGHARTSDSGYFRHSANA